MKKGDLLIIIIILLISIGSIIFMKLNSNVAEEKLAVLKIGGETIKTININSTTKGSYEFQFGENIGYVEVSGGQIRMMRMDKEICPQQICSLTGWIEKSYETIVCLPNRITVEINEKKSKDVDEISF